MAQHTAPLHVYMEYSYDWSSDDYQQKWRPTFKCFKAPDEEHRIYIGQQSVTFEVPDDFNPVPAQVAALEREKLAALEAYQRSVAQINERLSKLLAITAN